MSRNYTGAIYNSGTLQVIDSTFPDNSASTGGGIYDFARGGGIYNSAGSTLDVSNTHFIRNDAEDEGGGIFNAGQAEIGGRSFSGAHSSMGSGISAGWSETSSLIISHSVIYENLAVDSGGDFSGIGAGIIYWSGVMNITNTTISANYAEREGGGIGGYHKGASSVMFP